MFALILAALIAMGVLELFVMVQVGQAIGVLNTVGLLILISLVGVWLTKHEGLGVLTRLREQSDAGNMPTNALIDGGLILTGGLLLIVPGFVSDVFGLLLLFPPTRAVARGFVKRRFRIRIYGIDVQRHLDPRLRRGPDDDDVIDI